MCDPDSTMAILRDPLPSVDQQENKLLRSCSASSEEECEIFFKGHQPPQAIAKLSSRPTLSRAELSPLKRRSFEKDKGDLNAFANWRDRRSDFPVEAPAEKENSPAVTLSPATEKKLSIKAALSVSGDILKPFKELDINSGGSSSTVSSRSSRSSSRKLRSLDDSLQSIEEDKEVDTFKSIDTPPRRKGYCPITEDISSAEPSPARGQSLEEDQDLFQSIESPLKKKSGYCPVAEDISSAEQSPEKDKDISFQSLNSSTASQWFNNTHDELVLYEKYGEEYLNVVSAMSVQERRQLKRVVAKTEAKSAEELLGDDHDDTAEVTFQSEAADPDRNEPEGADNRDNTVAALEDLQAKITEQEQLLLRPTPKPRTVSPGKAEIWYPRSLESEEATLKMLRDDLELALSPRTSHERKAKAASRVPRPSRATPSPKVSVSPNSANKGALPSSNVDSGCQATPHLPSASQRAAVSAKATPSLKATPMKFKTPMGRATPVSQPGSAGYRTPIPKGKFPTPLHSNPHRKHFTPSYLRPTNASKHRASPRKDPVTNKTLDITLCQRHDHTEPTPVERFQRKFPNPYDLQKIVSPVSEYIHRNPVRQVRPLGSAPRAQQQN